MTTFRRRLTASLAALTTVIALHTGFAASAHAIKIPAPNKDARVSSTTVLMDGESNPCKITATIKAAQGDGTSLVLVEPGCGSSVRPLMGSYKYVKNGGESYEQVAAREAGKEIPHYTKEEVLISYGLKQPVYIDGDRDTGIVGYLVLQIPDVASVVELHAQYTR